MIPTRIARLAVVLILSPIVIAAGVGPCHPYPGAVAQDCLELVGNNLNNDAQVSCDSKTGRATLTLKNCSVVTKCAKGQTGVEANIAVRRALTTIGSCALNDYGSISGYYDADDGSRTCYLYPGRESFC